MRIAGVLLAAGASRRFGAQDKLLALLDGRALVTHAADALRGARLDMLIAVALRGEVRAALAGFDIVPPCDGGASGPEQSDTLRAGIARAEARGADKALIALGDMPFVTADLLDRVAARCTAQRPAAAAAESGAACPPACFPAAYFPELAALRGDRGAASLLRVLPPESLVRVAPGVLRDIDTPACLHAAQA